MLINFDLNKDRHICFHNLLICCKVKQNMVVCLTTSHKTSKVNRETGTMDVSTIYFYAYFNAYCQCLKKYLLH